MPTENEENGPPSLRKHTAGSPLTNTNKRAKMSQLPLDSSPLTSPPSSSADLFSPNQLSPPAIHPTGGDPPATSTEPFSQPPTVPALALGSSSSTPPTSNMSAKRAPQHTPCASPKRSREEEHGDGHEEATPPKRARSEHSDDENDEDTPPPKRPAAKSRAKAKPKPPAKKAATKKATAPKPKPPPKKPTRPPPAPSTRPTRNRKAPERLEDYQEPQTAKPSPARKGMSKVFDPVYITTNSTSRLGKADVYHMLLEGPAWTSLTAAQQSKLIAMLPPDAVNQALLARVQTGDTVNTRPRAFTLSNDCFRTDVAKFKEDLTSGHLAKTWLAAAEQAVVARAEGDFDEWKREEAERWWGQKGGN